MRFTYRKMGVVVAGACAVSFLAGCAKSPEQELSAAKSALQAAQTAEADKYLADQFKATEDTLRSAQSEIDKQNAAFALSRDYTEAKRLLAAASKLAESLTADAGKAKDALKAEVEAGVTMLQTAVKDAKDAVKKVKTKELATTIENELAAADSALVQVAAEIAAGGYSVAKEKVTALKAKVDAAVAQIQTAPAAKK